jgi:hypothetical protein
MEVAMRRIVTIVFASVTGALLVGAYQALAASHAEARLMEPVSAGQVIVDGNLWACQSDTCFSNGGGKSQPIGRECARFADEVGPVAAFRRGERVLTQSEVAACNG